MSKTLKELCVRLEHYETPEWAAKAILKKEPLPTKLVLDPCTGTGVLADAAHMNNYATIRMDLHDWGCERTVIQDFLQFKGPLINGFYAPFSVFMNPPFSKACEFVEKSLELGAEKVLCFQRFAWWESRSRKAFWEKHPPARVYICGDRAPCWRHDIPKEERNSSSPTAHAWFVWERNAPKGTLLSHIWKDEK